MADIDFDKIAEEATKVKDEAVEEVEKETKDFKPDLRIWIPFAILFVAFIALVIYTYVL